MLSTAKAIAAISFSLFASPADCQQASTESCSDAMCTAFSQGQNNAFPSPPSQGSKYQIKDPFAERPEINKLRKKLLDAGGELNGVAVVEIEPGVNGLIADHDMPGGAPLAFVPKQLLLTSDLAYKLPLVEYMKEQGLLNLSPLLR